MHTSTGTASVRHGTDSESSSRAWAFAASAMLPHLSRSKYLSTSSSKVLACDSHLRESHSYGVHVQLIKVHAACKYLPPWKSLFPIGWRLEGDKLRTSTLNVQRSQTQASGQRPSTTRLFPSINYLRPSRGVRHCPGPATCNIRQQSTILSIICHRTSIVALGESPGSRGERSDAHRAVV